MSVGACNHTSFTNVGEDGRLVPLRCTGCGTPREDLAAPAAAAEVVDLASRRPPSNRCCTKCGGQWFNLQLADLTPGAVTLNRENPPRVVGFTGEIICRECGTHVPVSAL